MDPIILDKQQISNRISYLELYLREHAEDRVLTEKMKNEVGNFNVNPDGYSRVFRLQLLYHMARRIRRKERTEKEAAYISKWENYTFELEEEPFDPENDFVDVVLTAKDGKRYRGMFTTRKNIDAQFAKNRQTGECCSGTYLDMPASSIVDRITEENVRTTIDDLIKRGIIELCFNPIK